MQYPVITAKIGFRSAGTDLEVLSGGPGNEYVLFLVAAFRSVEVPPRRFAVGNDPALRPGIRFQKALCERRFPRIRM
ncbi:MAG: hypothetical protein U5N26_00610 [Candidatus Marinimicrobia bacterium]|nr:hypothetical protein [Candidatus Neomarinimicrobiota bacterium]